MTAPDRDARARKVARLYASGLSLREAARRAGIHHQTAIDDLARLDHGTFGAYRRRLERRRVPARDKRMVQAVRLHTEGLSLRQIAGELGVSYQTAKNDLARWDAQQALTPANVVPLSKSGVRKLPPGGKNETPELDAAGAETVKKRRGKLPPRGQKETPQVDTRGTAP